MAPYFVCRKVQPMNKLSPNQLMKAINSMEPINNKLAKNYAPPPGEPQGSVNLPSAPALQKDSVSNLNKLVHKRSIRPPKLEGSQDPLPPYPHQFTHFLANKNKAAIEIPGYASVEDFLSSDPEESEEALAAYEHKNPKQEALMLLGLKKAKIDQHIDTVFTRQFIAIQRSTNAEEKKRLLQSFQDQVKSGFDGIITLENYAQEIVAAMQQKLDQVKFREGNRWVGAGTWPDTSNEASWNRRWQGRLSEAKAQVASGILSAKTRFQQEIDSKISNLQVELTRLANIPVENFRLPPQVRFLPPARYESLPNYSRPFENYDSAASEKNGLGHVMNQIGYSSVEDFLSSRPSDVQKAANSGYKNPKQEASDLLMTGGFKKITQHIQTRYEFYKQEMQKQSSPEAKRMLFQAFLEEMNANKPEWKSYLEDDKTRVSIRMDHALDTIQFRKPSRWFPKTTHWYRDGWNIFRGAPWTYSSVKERWNREWFTVGFPAENRPPRISEAKSAVRDGLQQTLNEIFEKLDSTITELSTSLQTLASQ
ncbi:MAG: hypothetical protein C5B47_02940 [Verrucomicrobia bacterium]|nr:MAG: hypothetical protein C5B47_02940 [Verrucomicrobiota bacterium]